MTEFAIKTQRRNGEMMNLMVILASMFTMIFFIPWILIVTAPVATAVLAFLLIGKYTFQFAKRFFASKEKSAEKSRVKDYEYSNLKKTIRNWMF
ncbi:MAG: hypothetical protein HOE90_00675 [Bacteriovoracaceae bacterium]|jgi:hypothetical protein|nr:hypothetical protein [Bacteriovoracaceae bacterium]